MKQSEKSNASRGIFFRLVSSITPSNHNKKSRLSTVLRGSLLVFVFFIAFVSCTNSSEKTDDPGEPKDNKESYSVTYDGNGSTAGTTPEAQSAEEGGSITVSDNSGNLEKTGYIFAGWNTKPDGGGSDYTAGSTIVIATADIVLYAKWNQAPAQDAWTILAGMRAESFYVTDITTDNDGNIYICGFFKTTFNGITASTADETDGFIVKTDSAGKVDWVKILAGGERTKIWGITVDSDSNLYIAGYTRCSLNGETLTGTEDMFIAKYNGHGNHVWTKEKGVTDEIVQAMDICLVNDSYLYLCGNTYADIDGKTCSGASDLFIMKYDTDGNHITTALSGSNAEYTYGTRIAYDGISSLYITGDTDSENIEGQDGTEAIISSLTEKFNLDCELQWCRLLYSPNNETYGRSVCTDSDGSVFVCGNTDGDIDSIALSGTQDVFLTKYSSSGERQWVRLVGSTGAVTSCNDIIVTPANEVMFCGSTNGPIDGNLLNGIGDAFVANYSTDGIKLTINLFGVSGATSTGKGLFAKGNTVFLTGTTDGDIDGQQLSGTADIFITTKFR